jgi:hypothetical protein
MEKIHNIRQAFAPYPNEILRAIAEGTSVESFNRLLVDTGLDSSFLQVFRLSEEKMEQLAIAWSTTFSQLTASLSLPELGFMNRLLHEPVAVSVNTSDPQVESLRDRGFVRVIEMAPHEICAVFYLTILEVTPS